MSRIANKHVLDSSSESDDNDSLTFEDHEGRQNCQNSETINMDSQLEYDEDRDDVTQGRFETRPCSSALNIKATQSSTPRETKRRPQVFFEKLDNLIGQHQHRLEKISQELKADSAEFLSVVASLLSEEPLSADNSSNEQVMFKGRNLMSIVATSDPCQFGRNLAKAIFGEEKDCALINYMIGKERCKTNSRPRVDPQLEKVFGKIVWSKYPREPEYCLREARIDANQLVFGLQEETVESRKMLGCWWKWRRLNSLAVVFSFNLREAGKALKNAYFYFALSFQLSNFKCCLLMNWRFLLIFCFVKY